MLRVFLTIVLPLIVPTAIYALFMGLRLAYRAEGAGPGLRWGAMPWIWLAGAGAVLLALVLLTVSVHFGTQTQGVYVPPRYEQGRIVPPHFEPKPNP